MSCLALKDAMACSEDAKGKGKECPRDGMLDCSIVDAFWLCREEQGERAGTATQFLSWCWGYKVRLIWTFCALLLLLLLNFAAAAAAAVVLLLVQMGTFCSFVCFALCCCCCC